MERLTISTVEEFATALVRLGPDSLYRGQVQHYGGLHAPAMNTSFDRQGCDPPRMLKWSHYARYVLASLLEKSDLSGDLEFNQAILQHYGFRSFFLDASSDPAVSAWFASHTFNKTRGIDMVEDCFEDPVMLVRERASYEQSQDEGHFYVLSRSRLAEAGLKVVDLSSIPLPSHRPRFHAQSAWLIGPLHGNLPVSTIIAYVSGPAEVFRSYAQRHAMTDTARLFPPPSEDPVLAALLSVPWEQLRLPTDKVSKFDIPFFNRSLILPEYSNDFWRKIMPACLAFYRNTSIREALEPGQLHVVTVPEDAMYGETKGSMKFPSITALLATHPAIAFEVDALIRLPESTQSITYSKGISVRRNSGGLVHVADLVVDHPGLQLQSIAVNMGWSYRKHQDETWYRESCVDDCPCPNPWRHEHHLSALRLIERHLSAKPARGRPVARGQDA